ncbi:MAG TPA: 4'-phosphopantetheinyl transferase superfamily protein [Streptosporangiaceae bacterium]|nr:4'-phosphopantetheinyl transferase superfamily protein [Streptosporangiaceae bacterium]
MTATAVRADTVASVLLTKRCGDLAAVAGQVLTSGERARADAYRDAADRRDFRAAHLLVRQVAARLTGTSPDALAVIQQCARCGGPHGRPIIAGHPGVHISLAHTRGAVIAAASAEPVGVDIESLRRPRFDPALLAPALTAGELQAVSESANQHAAVLRQWVRKEALVKAGEGSLDRLRELDLGHLGISGDHDPAPVRTTLGPRWPELSLADRVDAGSGVVFAVIASGRLELTGAPAGP